MVDGSSYSEGYVEIYILDQWGFICWDDTIDKTNAIVICRQLGFTDQDRIQLFDDTFENGEVNFVLQNVDCIGSESALIDCPALRGPFSCLGNRRVGLICGMYHSYILSVLSYNN